MKLFRSFRSEAVTGKRISRYLLYAIGEIILVVIGILIAVSINDHYEGKKSSRQLQTILRTYQQDLKTDTTTVGFNLRLLKEREHLFDIFLSDTLTAKDYEEHPLAYSLTMGYSPFEFQTKGYELLKNYADTQNIEPDSLVVKILATHMGYKKLVESMQVTIADDITDNVRYLKNNKSWTADLFLGNIENPEITSFFLSEEYRGRLAVHYILVVENLQRMLENYQEDSQEILQELEKRFKPSS